MVVQYEVTLYPNGTCFPETREWVIWKAAYWSGESSKRVLYIRYSHRREPKRFKTA